VNNTEKIGSFTLRVAKWVTRLRYEDIPRHVIDHAKLLILDGIGCTVFGSKREAGELAFKYVAGLDARAPEATIWGRRLKVPVRLAALVNGTSAHTTNIGDTHAATILHTNYLMPQAAIAVAEKEKLDGREILTAIIAGNEVAIRAGLATHIAKEGGYFTAKTRGWHSTGTIGGIGTAASAAKLLGLDLDATIQAIVLGGTQPAGMYRPSGAYMGKHLYAGKAAANGVESAYIARVGFVAGYRLYEDGLCYGSGILSPLYEIEQASAGLGKRWETLNVDMAIYPTKKTYYSNLD
jgi:aconitate decarboxylase